MCKVVCDQVDTDGIDKFVFLAISLLENDITTRITNSNTDKIILPSLIYSMLQSNRSCGTTSQLPKNGKRYFSHTITTSFLWQLTSLPFSETLCDLLILPSISDSLPFSETLCDLLILPSISGC